MGTPKGVKVASLLFFSVCVFFIFKEPSSIRDSSVITLYHHNVPLILSTTQTKRSVASFTPSFMFMLAFETQMQSRSLLCGQYN